MEKIFKWITLLLMVGGVVIVSKNLKLFEDEGTSYQAYLPKCELKSLASQEIVRCSELIGADHKLLLVHFWATTCPSCLVELPKLINTSQSLKELGVKSVFISLMDEDKTVVRYLKRNKISLEGINFLMDTKGEAKRFGTTKIPETYLYSKEGVLLKKFVGAKEWIPALITKYLRK